MTESVAMTCPVCNGGKQCTFCDPPGSGQQKCAKCNGSGWTKCPACDGTLSYCSSCGTWKGTMPCAKTQTCQTCEGSGRCHGCGGTGEV